MQKTQLILGIISIIVAAVISIFADGARRWYSGMFFAVLGVVLIVNAKRSSQNTSNSP